MKAKQLSVFLENKGGRLTEVTDVLGSAGINLSAMSIADNSDFGILRCIVSDPDAAYKVLKEAGFAVKITDVIGSNGSGGNDSCIEGWICDEFILE